MATSTKNVYAGGAGNSDYQTALKYFKPNMGYNVINTNTQGFDPSTIQKGSVVLGGSAVTPGISDDYLKSIGATRLYGADRNATATAAQNYVNANQDNDAYNYYNGIAQQQYQPQMQTTLDAYKAALASKINAYNAQKIGLNQRYSTDVANQNLINTGNKNNISNSALGRGLGRSSIVTSGLAEADQNNNRIQNEITNNYNANLNNIDQNIAQAISDESTQESTLKANEMNNVATLARQLLQTAKDNQYKQDTLDLEKIKESDTMTNAEKDRAIKQLELNNNKNYQDRALSQKDKEILDAEKNAANDLKYKYSALDVEKAKSKYYSGKYYSGKSSYNSYPSSNSITNPTLNSAYNKGLSDISWIMNNSKLSPIEKANTLKAYKAKLDGQTGSQVDSLRSAIDKAYVKIMPGSTKNLVNKYFKGIVK